MSLTKRFLNIARAELSGALRRSGGNDESLRGLENELEEARRQEAQSTAQETAQRPPSRPKNEDPEAVRCAYANLELPLGASAAEVRAAYRRLMRRYHPDHHHGDDDREAAATELAQQLRGAHDRLIEHLEPGRSD